MQGQGPSRDPGRLLGLRMLSSCAEERGPSVDRALWQSRALGIARPVRPAALLLPLAAGFSLPESQCL